MNIWLKKCNIRTKMMLSFSVPLLVIAMVLSIASYIIISNRYKRQIVYSANQSFEQASSYIENHIKNMRYVQLLLGANADLMDTLSKGVFQASDAAEQYREYWKLDNIIVSIELSNELYQCALYIPDELLYATKQYHFYPMSKLPSIIEEGWFDVTLGQESYFTDVEEGNTRDVNTTEKQVALLKMIYKDENIECISRVSIAVKYLKEILDNSDITKKGMSYLVNSRNSIIASSTDKQILSQQAMEELLQDEDTKGSWNLLRYEGEKGTLVRCQEIEGTDWKLISVIKPSEFYRDSIVIMIIFLVFIACMIVAIIVISYKLSGSFTRRLTRLSNEMLDVKSNNWLAEKIWDEYPDEIGKLVEQFYLMKNEIRQLMKEEYRLGKSVKVAELRALQAQINPHFLYNTLDLINWEAKEYGAQNIVDIVGSLGKFYRISLNKGCEVATVRDELDHIKAYIQIENYHFNNTIFLNIDAPEEVLDFKCIHIILQPFVENAIMHGIASDKSIKSCHISIQVKREKDILIFCIIDDGPGMTEEQLQNIFRKNENEVKHGYGAQNVNFRIKLHYGEVYGVSYESKLKVGSKVTIRIPIIL